MRLRTKNGEVHRCECKLENKRAYGLQVSVAIQRALNEEATFAESV